MKPNSVLIVFCIEQESMLTCPSVTVEESKPFALYIIEFIEELSKVVSLIGLTLLLAALFAGVRT
jgi:hypothetical protein